MKIFGELVKKYGLGSLLAVATLDGYRRSVYNDRNNKVLDKIEQKQSTLEETVREAYQKEIDTQVADAKNKAVIDRYKNSVDDYQSKNNAYIKDPTAVNKARMESAKKKLDESYDEFSSKNIGEFITDIYNKYNEYIDSLTPDKIVCLFNMILDGLLFSSFLSVLSIMLSDNVINRIKFLENYPRLFKLLKIRNNINKKVSKIYLWIHILMISLAFLGNLYMFFI